MIDAVKAGPDVGLPDPDRTVPFAQEALALHQRIGTGPVQTIALRVVVRLRFHDGAQAQQVQRLLRSVGQRGDP